MPSGRRQTEKTRKVSELLRRAMAYFMQGFKRAPEQLLEEAEARLASSNPVNAPEEQQMTSQGKGEK